MGLDISRKAKVEVILIANLSHTDPNFFYFTKLNRSDFHGSFLVLKGSRMSLIVPEMEYNLAKSLAKFPVRSYEKGEQLKALLNKEIREKNIGINGSSLTLAGIRTLRKLLKKKRFLDVSGYLAGLRERKTNDEIKKIRKACSVVSKVMREVPSLIRAGRKEGEIAAEIERKMKIFGADEIAFPTIVASGPNSASPHYRASERKLRKGDFVIVDIGCKYKNYCSDMSRTFIVNKASEKQKEIYETCIKMQKEILKRTKPGVSFRELQNAANKVCEKKFGKMVHLFGHGLGIEVHDPITSKLLRAGMVITVEPAIYVPKIGGVRIEDDVLVTEKGYKELTYVKKDIR